MRRRAVVAAVLVALALAGCEADAGPTPEEDAPTTASDRTLEFGVFGSEVDVDAYASLIGVFNSLYDGAEIDMTGYGSRQELIGEMRETGEVPDVFLADRRDLAWLEQEELLQPVDSLLIERGVDFGDRFSRGSVLAFSSDSRLMCMPVGISPMVMFYNPELIDFETMRQRGLPAPVQALSWNFEQFVAAAEFATRPRRGTVGFAVEPTLSGLSPFLYAAGGDVYDDPEQPTSLAFAEDSTLGALSTVLPVLRDPRLTLSEEQLEEKPALEWFKEGKLGMIPGFREQVPMLREVKGLEFDVLPIPGIERNATTGNFTGMCLSSDTRNAPAAADFLTHLTSPVSTARLATTGDLVPANLEVALSDDFVQPGREPEHAQVFTNSVRTIVQPPLIENYASLEEATDDSIGTLLMSPVIADLEALALQVDEDSRTVLAPDTETEDPDSGTS